MNLSSSSSSPISTIDSSRVLATANIYSPGVTDIDTTSTGTTSAEIKYCSFTFSFLSTLFCLAITFFNAACSTTSTNSRSGLLDHGSLGGGRTFRKSDIHGDLQWPLASVKITSPFGKRGRKFHEGIDLRAELGAPVYAAKNGVVIYSDQKIRGYGQMVVLRHDAGLATVYAHNSRNIVRKGEHVWQGQLIAKVGATGHAKGNHLHFEIRHGLTPLDPLQLLKKPPISAVDDTLPFRTRKRS